MPKIVLQVLNINEALTFLSLLILCFLIHGSFQFGLPLQEQYLCQSMSSLLMAVLSLAISYCAYDEFGAFVNKFYIVNDHYYTCCNVSLG